MLPNWIEIKEFDKKQYLRVLNLIKENKLNTVCIEANCPNRYECFSKGKATFMILGNICTRNCLYCNVKKGGPKKIDKKEPKRIAYAVKKLGLKYAVITCVTRDDLEDCGASIFVKVVKEIRKENPNCKIELLISDLNGNWQALKKIVNCKPEVINHNIEVIRDFFPKIRPKGNYEVSLQLLRKIKELNPKIITKSGFMLGFGENKDQIIETMKDLKEAKCDILIISQYLQPSEKHIKVSKYYSINEFKDLEKIAKEIGFKFVYSHPLARSSYMAEEYYERI
jgi:lipoic acid synthetase